MRALRYNDVTKELTLDDAIPIPVPAAHEALIKVSRASICSTDLHILNGYVPGFNFTLGHEFVGVVTKCDSQPDLVGHRVVGEINCRTCECSHPDPIFVRNHAPHRTVLGIIGKDGCMAEYITLPAENLHVVPKEVTDLEACFAEPLAAACRIAEQGLVQLDDRIAVVGDGKLGLLVAQVLQLQGHANVTLFGRHQRKMALVKGVSSTVMPDTLGPDHTAAFDVTIEASGSPAGITRALELTRPLGTVVVKSTCATEAREMPAWSVVGNDVVVNEKRLVGSRCGPFSPALAALRDSAEMRGLVRAMVELEAPLSEGVAAMEVAGRKGTMKVQLVMVGGDAI